MAVAEGARGVELSYSQQEDRSRYEIGCASVVALMFALFTVLEARENGLTSGIFLALLAVAMGAHAVRTIRDYLRIESYRLAEGQFTVRSRHGQETYPCSVIEEIKHSPRGDGEHSNGTYTIRLQNSKEIKLPAQGKADVFVLSLSLELNIPIKQPSVTA
jgi:hypothetical protein